MNNLILVPLIVPLLTGLVILILKRHSRLIAISTLMIGALTTGFLTYYSSRQLLVINFGGWQPPYGIQFAGDVLSLALCTISLLVTSLILLYGLNTVSEDERTLPLVLFLLVGVNGSFLTADIFNLFVQFEVMLLASFVLLAIGNQVKQLKASIPYVVINIIGSWLFLLAIGLTYRTYGTLSYAQLSYRVEEAGVTHYTLLIALLFLIVFSLKSALLLFMWLPKSYAVLSTETSALFAALLTKVGVYALLRIFTVIFDAHAAEIHLLLTAMSIVTMIIGCIGALAYRQIKQMICYQIILSIGIIIFGLATDSEMGYHGAILYLMNDMIIKALLFLIAGTIIQQLYVSHIKHHKGAISQHLLLGVLLFIVILTIGGVPPFGGFLGKLMIVLSGIEREMFLETIIMIVASLISMYTLLRLFIKVFFGQFALTDVKPINKIQYSAMLILLILSMSLSLFAEPLLSMIDTLDTHAYRVALMKGDK